MKLLHTLDKDDLEYILIEFFQRKGIEPNVKIEGNIKITVETDYDMEAYDDNF
jgi:hypothetical protein